MHNIKKYLEKSPAMFLLGILVALLSLPITGRIYTVFEPFARAHLWYTDVDRVILAFGFGYLFWMIFLLSLVRKIKMKSLLGIIIPFIGLVWFADIWFNLVVKHVFVGLAVGVAAWLLAQGILLVKKAVK